MAQYLVLILLQAKVLLDITKTLKFRKDNLSIITTKKFYREQKLLINSLIKNVIN